MGVMSPASFRTDSDHRRNGLSVAVAANLRLNISRVSYSLTYYCIVIRGNLVHSPR